MNFRLFTVGDFVLISIDILIIFFLAIFIYKTLGSIPTALFGTGITIVIGWFSNSIIARRNMLLNKTIDTIDKKLEIYRQLSGLAKSQLAKI